MRVILVRHAMCAPVGRLLAGRRPGIQLNDVGRAQAAALARALRDVRVAAIYSSPLERAVETAEAIAEATGVRVHRLDELTELDFGAWTGREIGSFEDDLTWRHFNTYRSGTRAPGGELAIEAQARVMGALYRLAEHHGEHTVVCVSHADVIRGVLTHVMGAPLDLLHRIEVDPASMSEIELHPWGARVLRMNHVVHQGVG